MVNAQFDRVMALGHNLNMFNPEMCPNCPKRDELSLSRIRRLIATVALPPGFVAAGCQGGPFIEVMNYARTEDQPGNTTILEGKLVSVTYGCSQDKASTRRIDVYDDYIGGPGETLIKEGELIIIHIVGGEVLYGLGY